MADDNKLDSAFGIAPAKTDTPAAPTGKTSPVDFAALGAKAYQSMTFGFGADLDRALFGKQAEQTTRELEKRYDKDNPFWSFGVDLAVGAVQGAAVGAGKVVEGGAKAVAKGIGMGAGYGALAGAGQGGDMQQRLGNAGSGALAGAAGGAAVAGAGALIKPLVDRMGKAGLSQAPEAQQAVLKALKSDGKTPQELESFLKKNPDARIADFSPKVADLVGQLAGRSNPLTRQLGDNLRADSANQLGRLQNPSQPLLHVKQQLAENLSSLEAKMQSAYRSAYSEVVPLSPELKAALDHPDVKPLVNDVLDDYRKLRGNPNSAVAAAPKYSVEKEIPTAVIDDLQKRMGDAAKDPANVGKMRAGAFQTAQAALKDAQPEALGAAHRLAATVGGEDTKTGIKGAQTWGSQWAMGLKSADLDQWRGMDPLQRQYARIGAVDGMERYLREKGQMTEGSLTKLADKMSDPAVREVLGDKEANQVKKVFKAEAARARTNAAMDRGGSHQAAFHEENAERMGAHALNTAVPGAGHSIGTYIRILKSLGVPEARAKGIIDIASKPGGMDRLRAAGIDKNVLDKISGAFGDKKALGGRLAAETNTKLQNQ